MDGKNDIVLVDTDVFSFLGKPGSKYASLYLPHVDQKRMGLSFITIGELYYGANKAAWSARMADLADRLRSVLIVPYDMAVCKAYADIKARLIMTSGLQPAPFGIPSLSYRTIEVTLREFLDCI
jgi:predicted nucleic acid-binding protein